jgi:hypothetical protein
MACFLLSYFGADTKSEFFETPGVSSTDISIDSVSTTTPPLRPTPLQSPDRDIKDYVIEEAGNMEMSRSSVWWLNSGGRVFGHGELLKTISGELTFNDYWRISYSKSNPSETDNGFHPQNIFRLIARRRYTNLVQSVYFKVVRYILSEDIHRSDSNGVFFFNHYQDENNLYYTGVRVDGGVVIKKKINGVYFTMAYNKVFDGKYDRVLSPNLLPVDRWIGIKSVVKNINDGKVLIEVYLDKYKTGNWVLVAHAIDDGVSFGGPSITNPGFVGIRSDFMDAEFFGYGASEI